MSFRYSFQLGAATKRLLEIDLCRVAAHSPPYVIGLRFGPAQCGLAMLYGNGTNEQTVETGD